MTQHIVIIGSGLAGYSLVKEFRALNKEAQITLITADRGDYYSKPQLSTAFGYNKTAADLLMNTAEQMAEKFSITVKNHCRVIGIDRDAKTVVGEGYECHFDQLILALGADKLQAPLSGDAAADTYSVNTLEEYESYRAWLNGKKRIAILGAGLVGCEFANDLIHAGFEVDVIAPDHYPLQRFVPKEVGQALQAALTELGVKWHLCRFPAELNHAVQGYQLLLDNMKALEVDGVVTAIGLRPTTQLAESAGLSVERGIVTNELLQTSDDSIYALGDCAEVNGQLHLHIAPLLTCARALAKTLAGTPTAVAYPPMPIIVKTPACSINTLPPVTTESGVWQFEGKAPNLVGQCVNDAGKLIGFVLSGDTMRRRAELMAKL